MSKSRVKLDLRGEICPYPLQETKREVKKMPCGTEVEVMVDCPPAVKNLSKWAENAGHLVLEALDLGPAEWMVVLKTCGDQATVAAITDGAATA
ncbi:MAG: sulfurtransferase TusA family protein [Alphaproteobacteria bacterium]|nr:sulfurtransferase TusA family protein [Alphaproteobacteria bacterium]MBT4710283.1 sulfurtransferase TusA family protein [Alphaproteobacteria bacterium]MBT5861145.1 sulfurtransferase TusA family protein [Alphaproteobacteria bacterium]